MSLMRGCTLLMGTLLTFSFHQAAGYGFLQSPMGRGTVGYPIPINPQHARNYCEVYSFLPDPFKCGVCGDKLAGPRYHEVGGKYATGKITGSYKSGATIPVKVNLDAKQLGWIEFRLCPVSNTSVEVTHECLNQHLLMFADGETRRTVGANENEIEMEVKLPDSVTCSHCVLQWKYHTRVKGRGCAYDGLLTVCSELEYNNCADVSISGTLSMPSNLAQKTDLVTKPMTKPVIQPVTNPLTKPVTKPLTQPATKPMIQQSTKHVTQPVTKPVTQPLTKPVTQTVTKPATIPTSVKPAVAKPTGKCVAIGNWVNQPGMLTWCAENCARGHCPNDMCAC